MDLTRPDVFVGGLRPRRDDDRPVNFHPATGELAPDVWESPPDARLTPHYLTLPGCNWPDMGESDVFPVERGLADLARVRWAPGRPVVFVTPGAAEPE